LCFDAAAGRDLDGGISLESISQIEILFTKASVPSSCDQAGMFALEKLPQCLSNIFTKKRLLQILKKREIISRFFSRANENKMVALEVKFCG